MSKRISSAIQPSWGWPEILAHFQEHHGPRGPEEAGYIEWLEQSPDLATAIRRATDSRKPDGKMHPHQTRVQATAREAFRASIAIQLTEWEPTDFHDLWMLCNAVKPWGIGAVTVYDVAERIGRYLRLTPVNVYLHAGVRMGAEALGLTLPTDREWLRPEDLPEPMRVLSGDYAEDFLCSYREILPRFR